MKSSAKWKVTLGINGLPVDFCMKNFDWPLVSVFLWFYKKTPCLTKLPLLSQQTGVRFPFIQERWLLVCWKIGSPLILLNSNQMDTIGLWIIDSVYLIQSFYEIQNRDLALQGGILFIDQEENLWSYWKSLTLDYPFLNLSEAFLPWN